MLPFAEVWTGAAVCHQLPAVPSGVRVHLGAAVSGAKLANVTEWDGDTKFWPANEANSFAPPAANIAPGTVGVSQSGVILPVPAVRMYHRDRDERDRETGTQTEAEAETETERQ
jgi:hypothetical protein